MITLTVVVAALFAGMLLTKAWNAAALAVARKAERTAVHTAA
jgi:hypothetical protein